MLTKESLKTVFKR